MAEPIDYFFQGANLGMRAGAARTQQEQFKTNLAERARQFDLNREIALGNLDLRQKEFTLRQENAVLDQDLARLRAEAQREQNNLIKKEAEEDLKFGPDIQVWRENLNATDAFDAIPKIPASFPTRIRQMLQIEGDAYRTLQQSNFNNQLSQQKVLNDLKQQNEMVSWAMTNAPQIVRQETDYPNRVYVKLEDYREEVLKANAQRDQIAGISASTKQLEASLKLQELFNENQKLVEEQRRKMSGRQPTFQEFFTDPDNKKFLDLAVGVDGTFDPELANEVYLMFTGQKSAGTITSVDQLGAEGEEPTATRMIESVNPSGRVF